MPGNIWRRVTRALGGTNRSETKGRSPMSTSPADPAESQRQDDPVIEPTKALEHAPPRVDATAGGIWAVHAEPRARLNRVELQGTIWVGFASYLNSGTIRSYVEIGRYCSIGREVSLGLGHHNVAGLSGSPFFEHLNPTHTLKLASTEPKRRVMIGHDCWIGDGVKILSGVKIGHGSVLAAGCVVTRDVAPYEVVGGIPARPIARRFEASVAEGLLESRWWDLDPDWLAENMTSDVSECLSILQASGGEAPAFRLPRTTIRPSQHAGRNRA